MSNDKLIEEVDAYIYKYGSERWAGNVTSSDFEAKRIINLVQADMKAKCLKAIEKAPFDLSSTEFPYKREHQEEGLNIAIKAIKDIK